MRLDKRLFIKPDYNRPPDYKSGVDNRNQYEFQKLGITIEINKIIDGAIFIKNYIEDNLQDQARILFEVGVTNKSHCGGAASFVISYSKTNKKPYLIYSGVKEVSNSIYHITIQGITEILAD